jgi:hypothetical protein
VHELLTRLQVATPPQRRSSASRRRARPSALLSVSEARQRERDQALTRGEISARQSRRYRLPTHPDPTAERANHNDDAANKPERGAPTWRRSRSIRVTDKLAASGIDFVGLPNAGWQPGASRLRASLTAAPGTDPHHRSPTSVRTLVEPSAPQRHVPRAVSSVLGPCRSAVLRGSNVELSPAGDLRAQKRRWGSLSRKSTGRVDTPSSRWPGHSFRDDAHGLGGGRGRHRAASG